MDEFNQGLPETTHSSGHTTGDEQVDTTEEALDEFGLSGDESEDKMESVIRQQAFEYHPDKGGSTDEFIRYKEYRACLIEAFDLRIKPMG